MIVSSCGKDQLTFKVGMERPAVSFTFEAGGGFCCEGQRCPFSASLPLNFETFLPASILSTGSTGQAQSLRE